MLLMELQLGHLQAHLSSYVPERSHLTRFILMLHLLHTILLAKRQQACNQVIIFILPSAESSMKIYTEIVDKLMTTDSAVLLPAQFVAMPYSLM